MADETMSERLCRLLSTQNFLKEFVFRDLYYYKDGKNKNEVCDCLIEFLDYYIIIEVKERGNETEKEDYDVTWLEKKVYKKAISQLKKAIEIIKDNETIIAANDCGRIFVADVTREIIPIAVFLNPDVSEYHKVHCSQRSMPGLNINIFNMVDFEKVLKNVIVPYDIFNYLCFRATHIKEQFPHLLLRELSGTDINIARIDNEDGFIRHYNLMQDKSEQSVKDILEKFIFICYNMESRLTYGKEEYLQILLRLISFNRDTAVHFVERWEHAVKYTIADRMDCRMHIIIPVNSFGILYVSNIEERDKIEFLLSLFKRKFALKTVLCIIFNKDKYPDYIVEWILTEDYLYDECLLDEKINEFNPWEKSKNY